MKVAKATIRELERLLVGKRQRLAELNGEREKTLARLAGIEKEIAALTGAGRPRNAGAPEGASTDRRARPGRKPKLPAAIAEVLAESSEPMRVADIVAELERRQFETKSKDPTNLVREAVSRTPGLVKVKRGLYTVKK